MEATKVVGEPHATIKPANWITGTLKAMRKINPNNLSFSNLV